MRSNHVWLGATILLPLLLGAALAFEDDPATLAPAPEDAPPKWRPGEFSSMRDKLRGNGPLVLIGSSPVQKELDLTQRQIEDLQGLRGKTLEASKTSFIQSMNVDRSKGEVPQVHDRQAFLRTERAAASKILSRDQFRRLWEIALQVEGPLAVGWPEVQDALSLTPSQRAQIDYICQTQESTRRRAGDRLDQLFRSSGGRSRDAAWLKDNTSQFDAVHAEKEAAREAAGKKIVRLLTRRQKDLFKKMLGEPFDVEELQRPGGVQVDLTKTEPPGVRND